MATQGDLLEPDLTREEFQALQNKRAGMFIFQVSWIMAFLCLVFVNWQMRFSPQWMPEGTEAVSGLPGGIATVVLLLSVFFTRRAVTAIRDDDRRAFMTQWAATLGLGAGFVVIMLYEWVAITTGTQYAQVFRLMTGFHVFHALVIGGYMLMVYRRAQHGAYGARDFWAVEAGAKLWYFVFIAWILFYVVIYWL